MRILYGVCGEGMGHAIRSSVVGSHLASRGHEVTFASSKGRASRFLSKSGPVVQVPGFETSMQGGQVQPLLTALKNIPRAALTTLSPIFLAGLEKQDLVISDFEPCVARYAAIFGCPLISIGNIEFVSHCRHPASVVGNDRQAAALAVPIANRMTPDAYRYMVTTFVRAPVRKPRTTLHAPILRKLPPPRSGSSVTVYFNDKSPWPSILKSLACCGDTKFRVFGTGTPGYVNLGNIELFPMGDRLLNEIASSRAVISGAGFSTLTECIYLHKPLLALPASGHFEQALNASYLRELGYGSRCAELTPQTLGAFLEQVPDFEKNLSSVTHDGNAEILSSLDAMIGSS